MQKAHPTVNTSTRGKQVVVSGSLGLKAEDMLECMLNLQSFKILNILISRWLNMRRCIRIHPWLNWRCLWCKPLLFAQIHFFVLLRSYEKRRQYDIQNKIDIVVLVHKLFRISFLKKNYFSVRI